MVLKLENNRIVGYGSYEHKETWKFYKCMWDKEQQNWYVPETADKAMIEKLIDSINEHEREQMEKRWKQACKETGYDFVKKGTPEYDEVKAKFKTIKNV